MLFYVYVNASAGAGGHIEGDIRMNGHPKEQTSFARVSGYVEQNDVHSPQTTVREALNFSAQLRFAQGVPADTIQAFVDEVMGLVELTVLQNVLVSWDCSPCVLLSQACPVTSYELIERWSFHVF